MDTNRREILKAGGGATVVVRPDRFVYGIWRSGD